MKPFRKFAPGGSPAFRGWQQLQRGKERRAGGAEPEPEPEPEDPRPAYMQAALDGYVSQDYGTEWSTDGADTDSGLVTAWPSMNGTLPDLAFQAPASAAVNPNPGIRSVYGAGRGRCDTDLGDSIAFLILVKQVRLRLMTLMTRDNSNIKAIYTSGGTLTLSNDPSSAFANFTGLTDGQKQQWSAYGIILSASSDMRAFLNGDELTQSGSQNPLNLGTNKKWGFGRFGSTGLSDFYIAEWMIYDNTVSGEDMAAWTAEAKARANLFEPG